MDPRSHVTATDVGKRKLVASEDSTDSDTPRFISTSGNMTNCYDQCAQLFTYFGSMHFSELIAQWMIAGCLGPIASVEEACCKGQDMLDDLILDGMLTLSVNGEMIDFGGSEAHLKHIQCKHQGFCVPENLGFRNVGALLNFGNIILTDGMLQRKLISNLNSGRPTLFSCFNPTPDSLKPLLENAADLVTLLIRGCGELLPPTTFPLENFRELKVLEISGCSYLTTIPLNTVSQIRSLRYLNLSDLLIESLPDDFFSEFHYLNQLILKRCSKLRSLPEICTDQLRDLDLSHCTTLQEIKHISYQWLGTINLSYTALTDVPYVSAPDIVTRLFLRDSKFTDINCFGGLICLEVLDLSGARELNRLDTVSSRILQVIDLSRTQVEYLDLAIFRETKSPLRCMILGECTSLQALPTLKYQLNLEVLDISGCEKLLELPEDLCRLKNLTELNLSGCSGLGVLTEGLFDQMSSLLKLDLSGTKLKVLPSFVNLTSLCKLSLRDLELHSLEALKSLSSLVELDFKGLKISDSSELRFDFLQSFESLQILNLSETSVAQLPELSKLISLKELLLADCQCLKAVPDLQTLTNLETLDLSLLDGSTTNNCQLESESEPQKGLPLSAPGSLRKLKLANRSGLQNLFALTSLDSLEFLDLRGTDVKSIPCHYMEQIKCIHLPAEIDLSEVYSSEMGNLQEATEQDDYLQGRVYKPVEIHMVCDTGIPGTVNNNSSDEKPSVFNEFQEDFTLLDDHISKMQENLKSFVVPDTTDAAATMITNEDTFAPSTAVNVKSNPAFKLEMLRSDLNYILENIEKLKNSKNYKAVEELLEELIDGIYYLSVADFLDDSTYLMQLLHIVIKLKVFVPPKPAERLKASELTQKKKEKEKVWFKRSINKEKDVCIVKESSSHEFRDLLSSYDCLSILQKCCLLCFSVFPLDEDIGDNEEVVLKSLVIKKRMLIYLWVGEGFLDPSEGMSIKAVEETGKDVFLVLADKGFIEPVMEKGRESGSCCMHPFVHSFVTAKAKAEGFFDFNQKSGKLTPHFTRSQRACLLESQENLPSSCKLWADYGYYRNNQESFKAVRTLFNVTESLVDIKPEWFSKMKHLKVLHLGKWRFNLEDHIELYDNKFLEELKAMRILRILSLQGLSRIIKLPDSVCKLANLIVLDLRECTDLEELPADIGSLKSLTHLDLTNCRHLTVFPKGIMLLSKLEVLKGFVITKQGCDPENRKVCTLKDLLNLKRLRKFNIVVKINTFPDSKELQVFKDMDNLRKLKITWEKDFNFTNEEWFSPEAKDAVTQEVIRPSKWKKLKCWEHQSSQDDREETSKSEYLYKIEKLELWCYPFEASPHWLNPSELQRLKKLYIHGGNLKKLNCDTNHNEWKVTTLRFKYLCNLDMRWRDLKNVFPNMTYLEQHQCQKLRVFHCDEKGVWIHGRKSELHSE